jgi:hypothetical protein
LPVQGRFQTEAGKSPMNDFKILSNAEKLVEFIAVFFNFSGVASYFNR